MFSFLLIYYRPTFETNKFQIGMEDNIKVKMKVYQYKNFWANVVVIRYNPLWGRNVS